MYIEGASDEPLWYVIHTYSGYEQKVEAGLRHIIENRNLDHLFFDIVIPTIEEVTVKDGKEKVEYKKIYPGYILIKMILNDESWLAVRNVRGVTSFVGPGSKPTPLTELEAIKMGAKSSNIVVDYEVGDAVRIIGGPLINFEGTVESINLEKQSVKVLVSFLGRSTRAELELSQIQKLF